MLFIGIFVLLVVVSMGGSVYVHIHVLVVSSKIFLYICMYVLARMKVMKMLTQLIKPPTQLINLQ